MKIPYMTRFYMPRFYLPEISLPEISITRRRALVLGAIAGGLSLAPHYAAAVTRLDITEGNFQPLPIAVPKFVGGAQADSDTASGVTQIITANLQRCGLFA